LELSFGFPILFSNATRNACAMAFTVVTGIINVSESGDWGEFILDIETHYNFLVIVQVSIAFGYGEDDERVQNALRNTRKLLKRRKGS
jgi:hypothetical protein